MERYPAAVPVNVGVRVLERVLVAVGAGILGRRPMHPPKPVKPRKTRGNQCAAQGCSKPHHPLALRVICGNNVHHNGEPTNGEQTKVDFAGAWVTEAVRVDVVVLVPVRWHHIEGVSSWL